MEAPSRQTAAQEPPIPTTCQARAAKSQKLQAGRIVLHNRQSYLRRHDALPSDLHSVTIDTAALHSLSTWRD